MCEKCNFVVSVNILTSVEPGRVTWVTFCPGHLGQIRFKNYPDRIMGDAKLGNMWYGDTTMLTYIIHESR